MDLGCHGPARQVSEGAGGYDMHTRIVRGGTALLCRQLLSVPLNAAGIGLASRLLMPVDFGAQAILLPIISLSVLVADLGTSKALVQRDAMPSLGLWRKVQQLKFAGALVCVSVLGLLSPWLVHKFSLSRSLLLLFPACGLLGWLQSQRDLQAVGLSRQVEWGKLARVEVVEVLVHNLVLVGAAWWLRSAWCFALGLGARLAVGALILRVATQRMHASDAGDEPIGPLLRFGVPSQVVIIPSILMGLVNPIVVGTLLGIDAVGLVNWSNFVVSLPRLPLLPLPSFLFSVLSERRRQGRDDMLLLADATQLGTFLVSALCLVTIVGLETLVRYAFGTQWAVAVPLASILLLGNVVYFPSLILAAVLEATGHTMAWLLVTVLQVVLTWSLAAAGTAWFGLRGYALGTLGALVAMFVAQSIVAQKLTGFRIVWADGLRSLLLVALSAWTGQVLVMPLSGSVLIQSTVRCAIGMIVFGVLVLAIERASFCRRITRLWGLWVRRDTSQARQFGRSRV